MSKVVLKHKMAIKAKLLDDRTVEVEVHDFDTLEEFIFRIPLTSDLKSSCVSAVIDPAQGEQTDDKDSN